MSLPRVLIMAGSDSGGGAGIQADLKAVAALGGHATTVVTALTAQNTVGVHGVMPVPPEFVTSQFRAVVEDIGLDALKIGMLHSAELVGLVAELIRDVTQPVVVDPVMAAKGGDRLLLEEAVEVMKTRLIPRATLLTPNLDEAEVLLGRRVRDPEAMAAAARDLAGLGADAVLVKGGHLEGMVVDVLFDGGQIHEFSGPRLDTPHTHGTGCTLASATATLLAKGWGVVAAVERARILVRRAIAGGLTLGRGHGPVHALADLEPKLKLGPCIAEFQAALEQLECAPGLGALVPEVRSQMGYATPGAAMPAQVLAVAGRITAIGGRMRAAGPILPGGSNHVAKIILTAMAHDPEKRAAMALRFSEDLLARARTLGWLVGEFDRADEPPAVKEMEGSTLEWGTAWVIGRLGRVPEAIFDRGETGKEPILRILANDPEHIVRMVKELAGSEE
ncbi:MAG: bifunctional hydroxymethylpyrimidine kinase/phosphomethylpyrimidine kinase [Pseudomonadota bacterium]